MLAADPITFRIGAQVITMRPTLRAAIRLERTHPLPDVLAGITRGSFTAAAMAVKEGAGCDLAAAAAGRPLSEWFPAAQAACAEFLIQTYTLDRQSDEPQDPSAKSVPWPEFFADLYRHATDSLGWSPQQTLDASPAEIVEAIRGRHEFIGDILKAVFGAPEEAEERQSSGPDYRRDADASATLRSLVGAA